MIGFPESGSPNVDEIERVACMADPDEERTRQNRRLIGELA